MLKRTVVGWGALVLLSAVGEARAELGTPSQFTIVDSYHYSHNTWYKFWDFPWQPSDWTEPVNYFRGFTYLRYDIRNLQEQAMLQLCYFQDQHVSEKHACGPQWTFDEPGIYYRRVENRWLWQHEVIDWTRPLLDVMLIDNTSEGRARTSVEVSMIVVAQGERLVPPDHWQCPLGWNCDGGLPPDPEPEPPEEEPEPEPEPPEEEPEPEPEPPEEEPEPEPEPPEEEPPVGGSEPPDEPLPGEGDLIPDEVDSPNGVGAKHQSDGGCTLGSVPPPTTTSRMAAFATLACLGLWRRRTRRFSCG